MRIRTIKPEFFLHDGLFDAEKSTGLPLRVAYAGLWCAADREGRFKWEPRKLGVCILPYDNLDFSRVLDALTTRGFLVKYECAGVIYGSIPSFGRHQVINNKERKSIIPEPPETTATSDASTTRQLRVPEIPCVEGKGREGNKEGKDILSGCDGSEELKLTMPPPKEPDGTKHYHQHCRTVLHFLNEQSGSRFREVDAHLRLITCRLREPGVTLEGVRQMIERQCAKWKADPLMVDYLRPQTLFAAKNFAGYYDAREMPVTIAAPNGSHASPPIGAQIMSTKDLLASVEKQIKAIVVPFGPLHEAEREKALKARAPLIDQKAKLQAKLNELQQLQVV